MITYVTEEILSGANGGANKFSRDMAELAEKGEDILLDMRNTQYITSLCIRTLLVTYKKLMPKGLVLRVINVTPFVKNIFEMTNMVELLDTNN